MSEEEASATALFSSLLQAEAPRTYRICCGAMLRLIGWGSCVPPPSLLLCSPLIAAGTYGKGRVVVFGHEAMLGADLSTGLGRLVRNSVLWAAGSKTAGINLATNQGGFAGDLLARLESWNGTLFTSFDAVAPADLPSNDYDIAVFIAK